MPFILKKMFIKEKQRAFLFIVKELGYTQKEAQRFISKGRVLVNGEIMDKSSTEIEGEIEFIYFEPISRGLQVHVEYDEFVVFDKPSGVLIHPQNRNTPYSLIDELKYQFGRDANIAHRIDQETSGLVLCSKNKKSERDIKMMFQERDMKKKYLAMVHGEVKDDICIEAPLLRKQDESAIVRMVVKVHKDGKKSKTDVKPLKYFPDKDMTLVECSPLTGRQHQIRVHLFHVKHSIVGDPIYGQSEENIVKFLDKELTPQERINNSGASRLLLHANELEFDLYNKKFHINSKVNFSKLCFDCMSL
ncbi:RluA family pseudouridine synthase [Candidatus Sulfurimonas baltica]|uniref:RNA pseudouridylate synthase n=1 Tax=Candidatus Sulfurimonas baltica TaxID=2740404 RepID=A0A7S7RN63_9BACT|nr:RluA family pseudouridine synthase [Candidatus Sulfurimonas baltica]QOY52110.1 RluA family pseudouridine synthase [Candidatus Sulfurimonas baltica]